MIGHIAFVITLGSIAVGTFNAQAATPPCDSARALRVLFVGNSFTYVSIMPKIGGVVEALQLDGVCREVIEGDVQCDRDVSRSPVSAPNS